MKKVPLIIFSCLILYSCNTPRNRAEKTDSEPMAKIVQTYYGAPVAEENTISATELEQKIAVQDSVQATVSAVVAESCQAKGCWMDVMLEDGRLMKVKFKNYNFLLPTEDLKGRTVIFSGTAKREIVSVERQQHYAEDAGKSEEEIAAITAPKEQINFIADGVILK